MIPKLIHNSPCNQLFQDDKKQFLRISFLLHYELTVSCSITTVLSLRQCVEMINVLGDGNANYRELIIARLYTQDKLSYCTP